MKKIIVIVSVVLIGIFLLYNVGFEIGNTKFGKQTDEIEVGSKFDLKNSQFSKDYLSNNSVIVVNLWASWCKPCIEEFPIFSKLSNDYPNVQFSYLSIDKDKIDLIDAIKKHSVKNDITLKNSQYRKAIRNFLEGRDLNSMIRTDIVPVTYVIKNGKVVFKETGSINYDDFFKKLNELK